MIKPDQTEIKTLGQGTSLQRAASAHRPAGEAKPLRAWVSGSQGWMGSGKSWGLY